MKHVNGVGRDRCRRTGKESDKSLVRIGMYHLRT
jgi:hypothetical protein